VVVVVVVVVVFNFTSFCVTPNQSSTSHCVDIMYLTEIITIVLIWSN